MFSFSRTKKRPAHPWGKPRRRGRWKVILPLIVVLAILAAPTIIGKTSLVNHIVASALDMRQGEVSVGRASLGWFSNVGLNDVRVDDSNGDSLIEMERIDLDRSVWNLIFNASDLGTIHIEKPIVTLRAKSNTTNLEELLAPWFQQRSQEPRSLTIVVSGGAIHATDETTGDAWQANAIEAMYSTKSAPGAARIASATASGTVQPNDGEPGRIEITLHPRPANGAKLDWVAERFPLEVLTPFVRRATGDDTRLAGRFTSRANATWTTQGADAQNPYVSLASLESDGRAVVTDLSFSANVLHGDQLVLSRIDVPWNARFDGETIQIETLEMRCDAGRLATEGAIRADSLIHLVSNQDRTARLANALREPFVIAGEIDLARLAAMLPKTLQIRDGAKLTSGTVQFDFNSATANNGHRWSGRIDTSALAAVDQGRAWTWEQPLRLTFAVRDANGFTIEALRCDSDFLQISASGNLGRMEAEARFDLDKLAGRLGQFVDFGSLQLGGNGKINATVQSSGERFAANATATLDSLRIAKNDVKLLDEPVMRLTISGGGALRDHVPATFEQLTAEFAANEDRLRLALRDPIEIAPASRLMQGFALDLDANGDIAQWRARLKHWAPLDGWDVAGAATLSARLNVATDGMRIETANLNAGQFQANGPSWRIHDPQVTLEIKNASVDRNSARATIEETTLKSSAFAASTRNISARFAGGASPVLAGEIAFRARLQTIDSWRTPSNREPHRWRCAGDAVGSLKVAQRAGDTALNLDVSITNATLFEYVPPTAKNQAGYRTAWQEPRVNIQSAILREPNVDRIRIETVRVASDSLDASVTGIIEEVASEQLINLQGAVEYDLAKWSPNLAPHFGDEIQIHGRDRATFEIAGALRPKSNGAATFSAASFSQSSAETNAANWTRSLHGAFSAGWESIQFFGLPIAAGRISTRLADGALELQPVRLAIGEGQINASGRLELNATPVQFVAPQGEVISNVRITPDVASRMLKYIAPILADATATDGRFSMFLNGGRIPIATPKSADLEGKVRIHSARVMPGPLAKEWLLVAEQIEAIAKRRQPPIQSSRPTQTWLSVDDQTIDFRVVDGRVHHRGFEFNVDDVRVVSRGSVGLDETLNLELEIPLPAKWTDGDPILRGLQGQSIRIGVRGTFSKPELDRRALQAVTEQVLRSAAKGAIEDQLLKLLQPKK